MKFVARYCKAKVKSVCGDVWGLWTGETNLYGKSAWFLIGSIVAFGLATSEKSRIQGEYGEFLFITAMFFMFFFIAERRDRYEAKT